MRTIAVINQKGGVGKTTSVANLGAGLAERGRNVCLVDLDPQAHLTLHFGIEPGAPEASIYDVMTSDVSLSAATMMVASNLSVVPSVIDLAAAEVELVGRVGREQILSDHLDAQNLPYDVVMIDCPPSLGLLTLNALAAADEVFIPLQPHFLALQGLGKLLETVSLVQRRINPRLRVTGVILCMYESTTRLSSEVMADLREFFAGTRGLDSPWAGANIFATVIRRNIKLAESPSYGQTIFQYASGSHGAEDYNALADEVLDAMERGRSAPEPASAPERPAQPDTPPQPEEPEPDDQQRGEPAAAEDTSVPPGPAEVITPLP